MRRHQILMLALLLTIPAGGAYVHWQAEPSPLLKDGPAGSFDDISVKDPTIVRYNGRWYLFYAAFGSALQPPSIG